MSKNTATAAIILAAGSSSRMEAGHHKLLLPLGKQPVLAHVIAAALASQAHPTILVLGHQAELVRAQIAPYLSLSTLISVENTDYRQGMSTSLRAGLQALIHHQNTPGPTLHSPNGAIIMLGDQPLLTASLLDALITCKQMTGKPIIAPLYNGRRGNPVLFDASLFPELLEIQGDEGARSVIERHRSTIATIEQASAAASYDVDTWDAYQTVLMEWEKKEKHTTHE